MDPVILVGRRSDGGHRDRLWAYCRERWDRALGWPIFEGHYDDPGPFCLAHASNRAAKLAGDWQVAVYVGADWIAFDPVSVMDAVRVAETRLQLCFAHDQTGVLSEEGTKQLLAGAEVRHVLDLAEWHTNTFSGVLAVPRALWDEVGGFDERFVGWGGEDMAFWSACSALGNGFQRVAGTVYHLWHPRSRAENEDQPHYYETNDALMRRYLAAKASHGLMLAILREPGAPNGPPE